MPLSMNIGHRIGKQPGPAPIPRSVAALLRRKGASMVIPGVGVVDGFHTGNWTDSTGTTPATIDGNTGLVVDAAGSVGDNVAPALEAANWSVVGNDATHIVTWQSGGGFRFQSDTTSPQLVVQSTNKLVLGKYYEFFITVSAYTSGSIKTDSVSGSAVIPASVGTHRFVGVAQSTTLQFTRNSTNVDLTVSSLQVRELTGIHALQATDGFKPYLRESGGTRYWQFDGTDDRLALSAVPFQMSDDHWVVVAATANTLALRDVFGIGNDANTTPIISGLRLQADGSFTALYRNDANQLTGPTLPSAYSPLQPFVISLKKSGNIAVVSSNGVRSATASITGGATTVNIASIGALLRGASSSFHNGPIYCVIYGKGAITDAELLLLEKFAGKLAGVQI